MKRLLCIILCLAMVLPMVPAGAMYEEPVTIIKNEEQFRAIMNNPDGVYRLEADIHLGSTLPLGSGGAFSGILDGNGHSVSYRAILEKGCTNYGLFYSTRGAQIYNLNVTADISGLLESDVPGEYYSVGGVAAMATGTGFGGVDVELVSRLECEDEKAEVSFGGLVGRGSGNTASVCTVNSGVNFSGCNILYYGLMPVGNDVFYSVLEGDADLTGPGVWVCMLSNATESICTQSVTMDAHCCDFYGDQMGMDNVISGEYAFNSWYGPSYYVPSTLIGLSQCEGSTFAGALRAGVNGYGNITLYGARESQWVEVVAEMDVESWGANVEFCGLAGCSDSRFEGSFFGQLEKDTSMDSWNFPTFDLSGCYGGQYNEFIGDIYYWGDRNTEVYGLSNEHNSLFEGDIRGLGTSDEELTERNLTALQNCTDSVFDGSIVPDKAWRINAYGIHWGSGNFAQAEMECMDQGHYSTVCGICDVSGTCGFEGTISGKTVYAMDGANDCYVRASIEGGNTGLFGGSRRSFFEGDVYTCYISPVGTDCYTRANIVADGGNKVQATYTENYWFEGNIDLYVPEKTRAWIDFDFPVMVHIPGVGTVNTGSMTKRLVYRHMDEWDTSWDTHPKVLYVNDIGEEIIYYDDQKHYELLLTSDKPGNSGTPESVTSGFSSAVVPGEGFRPEREKADYTLQMVGAGGTVIQGGKFIVSGREYLCDESGCAVIQDGPGAIHPLIAMAPDGSGGYVELRRINVYYPLPNRVNRIHLGSQIDVEIDLTLLENQDSESGSGTVSGGNVKVGNQSIPTIQFPLSIDLEFPLAKGNSLAMDWDGETNRLRVTIGNTKEHSVKPKDSFDFAYFDKLVDELTDPDGDVSRKATELLMGEQSKQAGVFFDDWPVKSAGFMEFGRNSNEELQLLQGGYIMEGSSEHRATWPITLFPGAYGTIALLGKVSAQLALNMGDTAKDEPLVVNMTGTLSPSIRAEGAIGGGIRAARLYAELGVGAEFQSEISLLMKDIYSSLNLDAIIDVFGGIGMLVFEKKITIAQMKTNLWPGLSEMAMARSLLQESEGYAIAPRTYADQAKASRSGAGYVGLSETGSYPYSDVSLQPLGDGRYLLVYTDDDLSRGDADRSTLRACIGWPEEGQLVWGESVTVDPDGTGDYGFVAKASGGDVALVWQDADRSFGNGENLEPKTLAESITLSQTLLDCSGDVPVAGQVYTIAEAGSYPYFMTLFHSWGQVSAAWVTTSNPDPSTIRDDEKETVWFSDGLGQPGTILAQEQNPITEMALTYSQLMWCNTDADGNGQVLSYDTWYKAESGKYPGNYSNLQANGDYLIVTRDGQLMESYEGFSPVKLDEGPVYNGQTMLGADGAIYTAQYGMDKSRIYAVEEGKARPIAELDGYVSSWAACDGYVVAITRSGFEETDTASFRAVQAEKIRDLQIAVMEVAGQQAGPGTDVCLTLQATNRGYEAITELPVTIACADAKCCTKIPLKWT